MSFSPRGLSFAIAGLLIASPVWAATLIEMNNVGGPQGQLHKQQMLIDDQHARMEGSQTNQYLLISFGENKSYMVNTAQKQVLEMPNPSSQPSPPPAFLKQLQDQQAKLPEVKAELVKKGPGPDIVGLPTVQYQVMANGELCSDEYISEKALENQHLKLFTQYMQNMKNARKKAMGGLRMPSANACAQAADTLADEVAKLGLSMRSVAKDGTVMQEVVALKTDVATKPDTFSVPKDYETMTAQQMMQKAMERMKQMKPPTPPTGAPQGAPATQPTPAPQQ